MIFPKRTYFTHKHTPAGTLLLMSDGSVITGIHWVVFKRAPEVAQGWIEASEPFTELSRQIGEYFGGERQEFSVEYRFAGTEFQQTVWQRLTTIKYGESSSYSQIALDICRPKAIRAVGTAVGSNPLSLIVPCHRVLPAHLKVGGYAGGKAAKESLLSLEKIRFRS